jgi:ketosteroid isomerase-like protein
VLEYRAMRNRVHTGLLFVAFASVAFGQTKTIAAAPLTGPEATSASVSSKAAEVLQFEREMEAAVVRGDVAYVDRVSADDLIFTHGDAWTTGGKPLLVDDKKSFLKRVENKQYLARDLDSVKVEMHGDIAITYGRYVAQNRIGDPQRAWFSVWFERVYAKRDGQWLYVSHKTVHGPTYGPDRESVKDK